MYSFNVIVKPLRLSYCNGFLFIILAEIIASQGEREGLSLDLGMETGIRCNEVKEK